MLNLLLLKQTKPSKVHLIQPNKPQLPLRKPQKLLKKLTVMQKKHKLHPRKLLRKLKKQNLNMKDFRNQKKLHKNKLKQQRKNIFHLKNLLLKRLKPHQLLQGKLSFLQKLQSFLPRKLLSPEN